MLNRVWSIAIILAALATSCILFLQPSLDQVNLLPDQGAAWYFWKRSDPNLASQASAWGGYLVHQFFIWGVIIWAKKNREALKDRTKLHFINWVALAGTAAFGVLHFFQTAIWYDGLAQNVSVFSSQASVILLLVVVLMIEAPRRGVFFGTGGKNFIGVKPFLIKYHGYYFSWAVVYTFWFHPMETTWGHLFGFFYTFLLMIQAGFIFTRVHTNRWWDSHFRGFGFVSWSCCCIISRSGILDNVSFWFFSHVHSDSDAWTWAIKTIKMAFWWIIFDSSNCYLFRERLGAGS